MEKEDFTTTGTGVEYWEYTYDLLNRLIRVTKNGTIVAEYGYDPGGIRVYKKVYQNGVNSDTIHYVFEGTEPLFEKRISDGRVRSYIYALGRYLARVDGVIGDTQTKVYYFHADYAGSIKAVTDQAGLIVYNADYLPFGTQFVKNGDFDELRGFTGKEYDPDIGLYYFNARWMDSELGRFISEDPVGDPNNPNLYSYGRNNPLSFIDPTGLETSNPGNLSSDSMPGGWDNGGSSVVPCPAKGGPSWVIPGALKTTDDKGNPIWIWGQMKDGVFTPFISSWQELKRFWKNMWNWHNLNFAQFRIHTVERNRGRFMGIQTKTSGFSVLVFT